MKTCSTCHRHLPLDAFWRSKLGALGRQSRCIKCKTKQRIESFDPDVALCKRYGVTPGWRDRMLERQSGKCAICNTVPRDHVLQVDHDHDCCPGRKSCGKCVRQLLCRPCNVKLNALEDVKWLAAAKQYLQQHGKVSS